MKAVQKDPDEWFYDSTTGELHLMRAAVKLKGRIRRFLINFYGGFSVLIILFNLKFVIRGIIDLITKLFSEDYGVVSLKVFDNLLIMLVFLLSLFFLLLFIRNIFFINDTVLRFDETYFYRNGKKFLISDLETAYIQKEVLRFSGQEYYSGSREFYIALYINLRTVAKPVKIATFRCYKLNNLSKTLEKMFNSVKIKFDDSLASDLSDDNL